MHSWFVCFILITNVLSELSALTSEQNGFFSKLPLACSPSSNRRHDILLCNPTAIWWFSVCICHHSASNFPLSPLPYLPCKKHKLLKISSYSIRINIFTLRTQKPNCAINPPFCPFKIFSKHVLVTVMARKIFLFSGPLFEVTCNSLERN